MTKITTTHTGDGLVQKLGVDDDMSKREAHAWIERVTGFEFDPAAMYKLSWAPHARRQGYTLIEGLRVWIMADLELHQMEIESRKYNKQPPGDPWEEPMFKNAMGRLDAARRKR